MKVAAIQMTSTRDVPTNLREAGQLVADAAKQGAKLVVLPENFSFLGATDADRVAAIEKFGDGPAQRFLAETAESLGLWIVGGTIPIRDGGDRASSRSLLVGPDGRVAAHYDKIHLFDVDVPGRAVERSNGAGRNARVCSAQRAAGVGSLSARLRRGGDDLCVGRRSDTGPAPPPRAEGHLASNCLNGARHRVDLGRAGAHRPRRLIHAACVCEHGAETRRCIG